MMKMKQKRYGKSEDKKRQFDNHLCAKRDKWIGQVISHTASRNQNNKGDLKRAEIKMDGKEE